MKPLLNSDLKVGSCYLGYHIEYGVFVFRYLGNHKWSVGKHVAFFPDSVPSETVYPKNTAFIVPFLEVHTESSLGQQCQWEIGQSLANCISYMLDHRKNLFPHFIKNKQEKTQQTKYKIVNSLRPLYRTV